MTIDIHAHYFPEGYAAFVEPLGLGGRMYPPPVSGKPAAAPYRFPPEDIGRRLSLMGEAGIERQVLSTIVAPYLDDKAQATDAARLCNDLFADFCRSHPDRLSFWASLPLPHVSASIQEVARAYDELGAVGVTLQCFCQNETIAREAFMPLFAALDRRRAVIFLHPCQNALGAPAIGDFGLTVCAGASIEDAVAAMHLIVQRVPERFPNIRFIVPHFGGILPMLLQRLDGQLPGAKDLVELPSVTARRFYYDTVGWGSDAALLAAATAFGATQLVPGSDWPILLPWESYPTTFDHIRRSGLPAESIDAILNRNAQSLLADALAHSGACAHHQKDHA